MGVIRLIGSVDSKVDVNIQATAGKFLGSWPRAEDRSGALLWRDLTAAKKSDAMPSGVGPDHWFSALRSVNSDYLSTDHSGTEKFLLYDLQMPYASPLKVKQLADFWVEIGSTVNTPMHNLTLYQATDKEIWRMAQVGDLPAPASPSTTRASTTQTSKLPLPKGMRLGVSAIDARGSENSGFTGETGVIVQEISPNTPTDGKLQKGDIIKAINDANVNGIDDFLGKISGAPFGAHMQFKVVREKKTISVVITLDGNADLQTADGMPGKSRKIQLRPAPTTQPSDLADAWKPTIDAAGIDPIDSDLIQRIILKYAFDPHRLTAVYKMDDAELDRLLPLEIVPQPAKIKRFALVIIINADPSNGTEIDDLIKQLGDNQWSRRDAAYHALAALGPAAKDKLTTASKNPDLEIAWRAERLLALSGQSAN